MLRMLFFALLISIPAMAQDAPRQSPPNIVVQPAPVIIREIPPAQVEVANVPQPLRIALPESSWPERYQDFLGTLIAAFITAAVTAIGWLVVLRQTGEQVAAGRQQTRDQIEASRQATEAEIRAGQERLAEQLAAAAKVDAERELREAHQLAAALSGELRAYAIEITSLPAVIRSLAVGVAAGEEPMFFGRRISTESFVIYRASGQLIGKLPVNVARAVSWAYFSAANSEHLLNDIVAYDFTGEPGTKVAEIHNRIADRLDESLSRIDRAVHLLDTFAGLPWAQEQSLAPIIATASPG